MFHLKHPKHFNEHYPCWRSYFSGITGTSWCQNEAEYSLSQITWNPHLHIVNNNKKNSFPRPPHKQTCPVAMVTNGHDTVINFGINMELTEPGN